MIEIEALKDRNVEAKALILYHANCIDGFTSAFLTWTACLNAGYKERNITAKAVNYNSEEEILESIAELNPKLTFIVDFSLSREALARIDPHIRVIIIDHHKTAFKMYAGRSPKGPEDFHIETKGNISIYLDMAECGASLCYKLLLATKYKTAPPRLVEWVRDYDLWEFNMQGTKAVNKYLRVQEKTFKNWERLLKYSKTQAGYKEMILTGDAIQKYHDSLVRSCLESSAMYINIYGKFGGAANAIPEIKDDLGQELALALKPGTYGAVWQITRGYAGRKEVKVSLRSNGSYDVEEIAKEFGGGGHKNAAGFTCSWELFSTFFMRRDNSL